LKQRAIVLLESILYTKNKRLVALEDLMGILWFERRTNVLNENE